MEVALRAPLRYVPPVLDLIWQVIDFTLHIDRHLPAIIVAYGAVTYLILFLIVFCETGLVVTPFLPGDSLLFATGAFCVAHSDIPGGHLQVAVVIPLLIVAAVVGDAVNYSIGRRLAPRFGEGKTVRFIKTEHLERTQRFYEKHGGRTIILARFIPIIRTFAPFVAGIGKMQYRRFATYNVVGAVVWVCSFVLLGYFFGSLPIIKKNFSYVILAILVLSVLPVVIEFIKARRESKVQPAGGAS